MNLSHEARGVFVLQCSMPVAVFNFISCARLTQNLHAIFSETAVARYNRQIADQCRRYYKAVARISMDRRQFGCLDTDLNI